jgi:hypothetical protein
VEDASAMWLPRVRFTIGQLMILIAVVGCILCIPGATEYSILILLAGICFVLIICYSR